MARINDLVIRIAGEAGEGVQSTGQLLAQASARAGYMVLTDYVPPAEIKGGHAVFQIRLSDRTLHARGDHVDILLAFNQEAYDVNIDELRPGGLLIYDSDELTPPESDQRRQVDAPLTDIAKRQLRFELGKNVVAVGVCAALFGLDVDVIRRLLREKFLRKGEEVVNKNLVALQAGIDHVVAHVPDREIFRLEPGEARQDVILVTGNQSLALGAIAAGCRFLAGYPITPASDVMEFLANELPRIGGSVVQAEDEISSIGMVVGASYAGKKAMTSTAGPGLSLMTEMLGLATMAELPCVVADIQRAGPSTGMPTRQEQGDLNLAIYGAHGEAPRIVLAATSVEDLFYQAVNAFNLAEKYQTPVIFLSDTTLAVRAESIRRPDSSRLEIWNRLTYNPPGEGATTAERGLESFKRYECTDSGISPISVPGTPGGQYVATGLEHSEYGGVRYDPVTHRQMTEKRFRKIMSAAQDAPAALRYGDPDAEVGIIAWGSTAGQVIEAIDRLAARGLKTELLAPKLLFPLPDHQLRPFLESKRTIIVPEVNYTGQFRRLLEAEYRRPLVGINTYTGHPFKVGELADRIADVLQPAAVAADD